jgi:hypothetical protein
MNKLGYSLLTVLLLDAQAVDCPNSGLLSGMKQRQVFRSTEQAACMHAHTAGRLALLQPYTVTTACSNTQKEGMHYTALKSRKKATHRSCNTTTCDCLCDSEARNTTVAVPSPCSETMNRIEIHIYNRTRSRYVVQMNTMWRKQAPVQARLRATSMAQAPTWQNRPLDSASGFTTPRWAYQNSKLICRVCLNNQLLDKP